MMNNDKVMLHGLDALRGVAAIAVLLFHRRWWFAEGGYFLEQAPLAVDFFFILSGAVLTHAYAGRLAAGLGLRRFMLIRVVRLYPLLIVGAVLGFLFYLTLNVPPPQSELGFILVFGILNLPQPGPGIVVNTPFFADPPAWSIFFELVANALFIVLIIRLRSFGLFFVAVGSAALFFPIIFTFGSIGYTGNRFELVQFLAGVPRCLCSFAIGILVYRWSRNARFTMPVGTTPVLALILIATFTLPNFDGRGNAAWAAICIFVIYPVIIFLAINVQMAGWSAAVARFSGYLSYPVYILHFPLLFWLTRNADTYLGIKAYSPLGGLAMALVTVAICILIAVVVDAPARRWLSRLLG